MFDIGLTEIMVIVIAAAVFLDAQDIPKIFKFISKIFKYCDELFKEIKRLLSDLNEDFTHKIIIDKEGVEHKAYDLSDIMPDLIEDDERKPRTRAKKN